MKKKFLAIYALAGALVASPIFTSCVDDKESDSVTAVRNAKAEQLKALAALSNAQAEAEKIQAEAQAALDNAEAEYRKNQTEEAKQKFAAQLEAIKAQAERDMWSAKWQAAQFEQNFNDLADDRVKELYNDYQNEVGNLNILLSNQLNEKNNLAQLKADLITTEEYASINNARFDKWIAENEFKISLYEKYEGADLDKLKQDLAVAEIDAKKLREPLGELENKKDDANNAYDTKLEENGGFSLWSSNQPLATLKAAKLLQDKHQDYNFNYIKVNPKNLAGDKVIDVVALDAEKAAVKKTEYENSITDLKRQLGEPATETTEASGLYQRIENYKRDIKSSEEAIKQYEENIEEMQEQLEADSTQTWLQNSIDNLNSQISYKKEWIAEQEANIKGVEEVDIPKAQLEIMDAEEKLKEFEAAVKSFDAEGEDWKAYQAAIAEQTKLAEAVVAAQKAYDTAEDAWKAKNAEVVALNNIISNSTDVEKEILSLKYNITSYKEQKQWQLNNVSNKEALIAQAEEQLKTYETQITAQKAIIANIEEAIKAAIGETEA